MALPSLGSLPANHCRVTSQYTRLCWGCLIELGELELAPLWSGQGDGDLSFWVLSGCGFGKGWGPASRGKPHLDSAPGVEQGLLLRSGGGLAEEGGARGLPQQRGSMLICMFLVISLAHRVAHPVPRCGAAVLQGQDTSPSWVYLRGMPAPADSPLGRGVWFFPGQACWGWGSPRLTALVTGPRRSQRWPQAQSCLLGLALWLLEKQLHKLLPPSSSPFLLPYPNLFRCPLPPRTLPRRGLGRRSVPTPGRGRVASGVQAAAHMAQVSRAQTGRLMGRDSQNQAGDDPKERSQEREGRRPFVPS